MTALKYIIRIAIAFTVVWVVIAGLRCPYKRPKDTLLRVNGRVGSTKRIRGTVPWSEVEDWIDKHGRGKDVQVLYDAKQEDKARKERGQRA